MRCSPQIEQAPETKIVVDETVAHTFRAYHGRKRHLESAEHDFEKLDKIDTHVDSQALHTTQEQPNRQKLFLHQSVSRFKPPNAQLCKWIIKLDKAPKLLLPSGCVVTLIQPNTKRPGRTFLNPTKPQGKYRYNDGLSYAAIVLLHSNAHPVNQHDEASHLCGISRCISQHHLCWEGIGKNASRNECHLYGVECTHVPACVAYNCSDAVVVKNAIAQECANKQNKKQALTKYFLT